MLATKAVGKAQNRSNEHLKVHARKYSVKLDVFLLELRRWMGDGPVDKVLATQATRR